MADVSPIILLLDRGYVEVEAPSYPIKKRVSWVLSHQETVQSEKSSIVHSDPGDLEQRVKFKSRDQTTYRVVPPDAPHPAPEGRAPPLNHRHGVRPGFGISSEPNEVRRPRV